MIICHCHAVNDRQIKEAIAHGIDSVRGLNRELNVGNTCGQCLPQVRRVLESTLMQIAEPSPKKVA
ncbi:(2Fe-2S)-binding protein [Tolumonas lignilytica]|uniref:(2Fe-2S)-binding protein n=1 Tax=Tolumonas lignilytica TaxID=1283284 RepID=UPI000465D605|nr:(2Fe-2S)-binding protein [Tolumonas lignilytica]